MNDTHSARIATIERILEETYQRGTVALDDGTMRSIYPTGMRAEQGERIGEIVVAEGALTSFETGFGLGLSTLRIVRSLLKNGANLEGGPVHRIFDPFQAAAMGNAGVRLCAESGIADVIDFEAEDSQLALPRLVTEGASFDIALVDGGHTFEIAFTDILYALKLVKPGGLVMVDDTWMPAVRWAVEFMVSNLGIEIDADASIGAESWRRPRTLLHRAPRRGKSIMLGLRVPAKPVSRAWDHFVPFEA